MPELNEGLSLITTYAVMCLVLLNIVIIVQARSYKELDNLTRKLLKQLSVGEFKYTLMELKPHLSKIIYAAHPNVVAKDIEFLMDKYVFTQPNLVEGTILFKIKDVDLIYHLPKEHYDVYGKYIGTLENSYMYLFLERLTLRDVERVWVVCKDETVVCLKHEDDFLRILDLN